MGVTTSTRVARVSAIVGILKRTMRKMNATDGMRMAFLVIMLPVVNSPFALADGVEVILHLALKQRPHR